MPSVRGDLRASSAGMAPISSDLDLGLSLNLGEIERKVDMSLDEIIKQSKETGRRRWVKVKSQKKKVSMPDVTDAGQQHIQKKRVIRQNKKFQQGRNMPQGRVPGQRRDLLQRVVALRSSAARQGKLAEARSQNGFSTFALTRLAAQKTLSGTAIPSLNRQNRKPVQGTFHPAGDVARNGKIVNSNQVINEANGIVAARWPSITLPRKSNWTSKALRNGSVRKLQTLDSRFATLREERQLQQSAAHGKWRR